MGRPEDRAEEGVLELGLPLDWMDSFSRLGSGTLGAFIVSFCTSGILSYGSIALLSTILDLFGSTKHYVTFIFLSQFGSKKECARGGHPGVDGGG
jgi:hypothetical protein